MLTLHALRIEPRKYYRVAVDLLSEMLGVLNESRLTRLPSSARGLHGFLPVRGVRFSARQTSNALARRHRLNRLRLRPAQPPLPQLHALPRLDAEKSLCSWMSKRCTSPTSTRLPRRNTTRRSVRRSPAGTQAIFESSLPTEATRESFRDELRDNGIRPLIKHRIMNPLNHTQRPHGP